MEKKLYIIIKVKLHLKENIYKKKKKKEKNILMENQNMREIIYIIENGMVTDMMKMEI